MSPKRPLQIPKSVYVAGVVLLVLLSCEWLLYKKIAGFSRPEAKHASVDPKVLLLNVNEVTFHTSDGVDLHGWLIPGKTGYPAMIIAHDYASDRAETLGRLEGLISELHKKGYFVFLFDFRGHGASGSKSYLGFREALDMEAALKEVLKYKQIGKRIGVIGIGMGAVAAIQACKRVDETKLVILDSIYDDIPGRTTDAIIAGWPMQTMIRPILLRLTDWNLDLSLKLESTQLGLDQGMPALYPRAVLFADTNPPSPVARRLYEATREPKELLQMGVTASGELMGDSRTRYIEELLKKITEYFPATTDQQTLEITK